MPMPCTVRTQRSLNWGLLVPDGRARVPLTLLEMPFSPGECQSPDAVSVLRPSGVGFEEPAEVLKGHFDTPEMDIPKGPHESTGNGAVPACASCIKMATALNCPASMRGSLHPQRSRPGT